MGKRGPAKQHDDRLDIALPGKLKLKLFSAAKRQGKTVSQYVRELVESGLRAGSDIQEAYDQGYADGAGRRQPRELVEQALGKGKK